jgi:hypothetical protein
MSLESSVKNLPAGRLLYRQNGDFPYIVVRNDRCADLWLVEEGWSEDSVATGPFAPEDALRAYRIANAIVPEGCELGPWQRGLALLGKSKLPGQPSDWSPFELSWLPPTVTVYPAGSLDRLTNETCCAPICKPPRVRLFPLVGDDGAELARLVRQRHPQLDVNFGGTLDREWNLHPEGSPAFARHPDLSAGLVVVDLPPGSQPSSGESG